MEARLGELDGEGQSDISKTHDARARGPRPDLVHEAFPQSCCHRVQLL